MTTTLTRRARRLESKDPVVQRLTTAAESASRRGDHLQAATYWTRALAALPGDHQDIAAALMDRINRAYAAADPGQGGWT